MVKGGVGAILCKDLVKRQTDVFFETWRTTLLNLSKSDASNLLRVSISYSAGSICENHWVNLKNQTATVRPIILLCFPTEHENFLYTDKLASFHPHNSHWQVGRFYDLYILYDLHDFSCLSMNELLDVNPYQSWLTWICGFNQGGVSLPDTIPSMGLEDLPTWMVDVHDGKCRETYHTWILWIPFGETWHDLTILHLQLDHCNSTLGRLCIVKCAMDLDTTM